MTAKHLLVFFDGSACKIPTSPESPRSNLYRLYELTRTSITNGRKSSDVKVIRYYIPGVGAGQRNPHRNTEFFFGTTVRRFLFTTI